MKIQLFIPEKQKQSIPFEDCEMVSVAQLEQVPNASCNLIHIGNCGDFIGNYTTFYQLVCGKLRYGGHVVVEGNDLMEISFALNRGFMTPADAQQLVCMGRQICITRDEAEATLQGCGLNIVKSRLSQYKYSIRAERPNV